MSAYKERQLSMNDQGCLVDALKELKLEPVVHKTPQQLEDYVGKRRPDKAEIILPRKTLNSMSNDIGFALQDGKFKAIISQYDSSIGYGEKWLKDITAKYTEIKAKKTAKMLNLRPIGRRVLPNGRIQLQYQKVGA